MGRALKKLAAFVGAASLSLTGCDYGMQNAQSGQAASLPDTIIGQGGQVVGVGQSDANSGGTNQSQTVCDPLDDGGVHIYDHGLKGKLYYLNASEPRYKSVEQYITPAHEASVDVYMNKVFVPTRPFDRGFITMNGNTVTNDKGETLFEYFGLKLNSQVKLGLDDEPGLYQFALISDDGAKLNLLNANNQMETIVNNDGETATRMACAQQVVQMGTSTRLPMELKYFQGPRYHIAVIIMWRKVSGNSATDLKDVTCGKSGNDLFFDYTKDPSVAKPTYNQLLARGWKPLGEDNFLLPEEAKRNPCVDPSPTPSPAPTPNPTPVGEGPGTSPTPSPVPAPTPTPTPVGEGPGTSPSPSPAPVPSPSPTPGPWTPPPPTVVD